MREFERRSLHARGRVRQARKRPRPKHARSPARTRRVIMPESLNHSLGRLRGPPEGYSPSVREEDHHVPGRSVDDYYPVALRADAGGLGRSLTLGGRRSRWRVRGDEVEVDLSWTTRQRSTPRAFDLRARLLEHFLFSAHSPANAGHGGDSLSVCRNSKSFTKNKER